MREFFVIVLTIWVSLLWGCADDETPTAPQGDPYEFVATVHMDSCSGFPPGLPVDDLCGGSSDIRASFEFVYDGVKEEYIRGDQVIRAVTFKTGPGTWEFLNHGCTRGHSCRLSDALHGLFAGRPLTIYARRWTSPTDTGVTMVSYLVAGDPVEAYSLLFSVDPHEMTVDAAGFPAIDGDLTLGGGFQIDVKGETPARGSADVTIKNWSVLPLHHKPEPPVIVHPTFTAQELRGTYQTLKMGPYTLAFEQCEVSRDALNRGISVSFSIWEQGLWDFDRARLDYLWVVHESGEIWEPEIPSAWDHFRIDRSARDGPLWEVGTTADVVAGFVDFNGSVRFMRFTDTIKLSL